MGGSTEPSLAPPPPQFKWSDNTFDWISHIIKMRKYKLPFFSSHLFFWSDLDMRVEARGYGVCFTKVMRKISSLPGADRPSVCVWKETYILDTPHTSPSHNIRVCVCVSIDPSFQKSQKVVFPRALPPTQRHIPHHTSAWLLLRIF